MERKSVSAPKIATELARVEKKLEKKSSSTAERMELLRRQAALGDLRDELALRKRREAS